MYSWHRNPTFFCNVLLNVCSSNPTARFRGQKNNTLDISIRFHILNNLTNTKRQALPQIIYSRPIIIIIIVNIHTVLDRVIHECIWTYCRWESLKTYFPCKLLFCAHLDSTLFLVYILNFWRMWATMYDTVFAISRVSFVCFCSLIQVEVTNNYVYQWGTATYLSQISCKLLW